MEVSGAERERQRFEHLVLGHPRPRGEPERSAGKRRKRKPTKPVPVIVLAPGIEERVALRERWSHKQQGTPETHEFADRIRRRAGSLARLHATGTINADQLAAAQMIGETWEAIAAAVSVRTASIETRVDCGFRPGLASAELAGGVWLELIYDRWRGELGSAANIVLVIVVDDVALTVAARRYRMSDRRARALLVDALNLWISLIRRPRR